MDQFFKLFGRHEQPFGEPKQEYRKFEIVPRSKTFNLRNTPYKELFDRMY